MIGLSHSGWRGTVGKIGRVTVELMQQQYGIQQGVEIKLRKNIPVAAGMAGGSTDAAVTMIAMNELYELGLTREELMQQALVLGADIPFVYWEALRWRRESGRSSRRFRRRRRHRF